MTAATLRLGMAMWSHAGWQGTVYGASCPPAQRLQHYARVFSSVEGNTTFYATPPRHTAAAWAAAVPAPFRFTFKLPQQITHQQQLRHCQDALRQFFLAMEPLLAHTAQWQIQLPAQFAPDALPALAEFIAQLPAGLPIGVEVRHREFFAKGAAERALHQLLQRVAANRIVLDSRPLFAAEANNDALREAQQKKPKLPVHAVATGPCPTVRFIGQTDLHASSELFTPWLPKLTQWLAEGRSPQLFVHTPDNAQAPQLAELLWQRLQDYRQQQGAAPLPTFALLTPPQGALF